MFYFWWQHHPELETGALSLLEILNRAMPSKKSLIKSPGSSNVQLGPFRKKPKEKSEKKKKKPKVKEEESEPAPEEGATSAVAPPSVDIPHDENAMDGMNTSVDETDTVPMATR